MDGVERFMSKLGRNGLAAVTVVERSPVVNVIERLKRVMVDTYSRSRSVYCRSIVFLVVV